MNMAVPSHTGFTGSPRTDDVSPELALVDPAVAEHARSELPRADDTLARIELLVRARRIAASRAMQAEAAPAPARAPVSEPAPAPVSVPTVADVPASTLPSPRRIGRRRSTLIAGGVAAGVFGAALLVGVRVDVSGNPAGADSTTFGDSQTSASSTTPTVGATDPGKTVPTTTPVQSRPPKAPASRNFAWAPVGGASGYHVEFFRGSALVFSANTIRPTVSIPTSWSLHGQRQSLEPGEYRWNVWPVISGRRATQAVVQAKLVVPAP
jgi:hypothetical protein